MTRELLEGALTLRQPEALAGLLGTVLQLTLVPLLMGATKVCAVEWAEIGTWTAGMCPMCAAWPSLAESRGLDRQRWLRCGRCGSGWVLPWQLCPFCANDSHAGLGYLYSEELGEARRVFACERCHGYLKTMATLSPIEPLLVPLEDLDSMELDLAAIDGGYQRPAESAFPLEVQLSWDR